MKKAELKYTIKELRLKIEKLHLENFKSFDCQDIYFDNFNLILGTNASGKSNTISAFRFINNIINYGIEDSISLMGGMEYTMNASIGKSKPIKLSFYINLEDEEMVRVLDRKAGIGLVVIGVFYEFEIQANKSKQGFKIIRDFLKIGYRPVKLPSAKGKDEEDELVCISEDIYYIEVEKTKSSIAMNVKAPKDIKDSIQRRDNFGADTVKEIFRDLNKEKRVELILRYIDFFVHPRIFIFRMIRIYDFDPKLLKRASSLKSLKSLEEDGVNLPNILQTILKNPDKRRELSNILTDCLPFIEKIEIENNIDKSLTYKIKEKYNKKAFYANFLSDGTVNILAIIVALYFEGSAGIIIIEEPERNLHPKLMRKVVDMARETSKNKQIILTTHNPEFVKYTDLESILYVSKDVNGFSNIGRPSDNQYVKSFISNELGVEDLFVQGLLGD